LDQRLKPATRHYRRARWQCSCTTATKCLDRRNQYLPQIFGRGHYLVLDHINSLPNKLPEIYFRLRR